MTLVCCCCLFTKSCLTLCHLMDSRMASFPVLHCFPEFAQSYVHWINDAIQPSHPLSSPSPPAFNFSQYQGLFQWLSSLSQVAKSLELQHQSFQWIFRVDFFFRIDCFDLLAVQGTLKSLLQQHNSTASIVLCSAFMVQRSHLFMTTGRSLWLFQWKSLD